MKYGLNSSGYKLKQPKQEKKFDDVGKIQKLKELLKEKGYVSKIIGSDIHETFGVIRLNVLNNKVFFKQSFFEDMRKFIKTTYNADDSIYYDTFSVNVENYGNYYYFRVHYRLKSH